MEDASLPLERKHTKAAITKFDIYDEIIGEDLTQRSQPRNVMSLVSYPPGN